jgi:hypothetical protein
MQLGCMQLGCMQLGCMQLDNARHVRTTLPIVNDDLHGIVLQALHGTPPLRASAQ